MSNAQSTKPGDSYSGILKSTSIVGGSQAINYLISMVRIKLVALLLGPNGVGMIGLFQSSIGIVTQLTGLGIASSGVRQIAEAHGTGDVELAGKTLRVLRRLCWATGILGWLVTAVLARPLSNWAFDSPENTWLIAILGATLFFTAISGGQRALIQGTRRITDLARMTVLSAVASTIAAVSIYAVHGEQGIVPALITTAIINLIVSWWFAKRVAMPVSETLTWRETYQESKKLTNLGFAFMWGGLLAAATDLGIRSLIIREIGVDGTGIYQAAWGLSGLFANFIINAMGADFYPRITAVANDHAKLNAMVNQQIEVGCLIALPGILGTLACAPLLMTVFYSQKFSAGANLLPWLAMGVFCRVISSPVGFSLLAKNASKWFVLTQTFYYSLNIVLVWFLLKQFDLVGVGIAFFLTLIPVGILNIIIANRLYGFTWSSSVRRLVLISAALVAIGFASAALLPTTANLVLGSLLSLIAGILCLRGIVQRVGPNHKISRMISKIPLSKWILFSTSKTNREQ